MSKKYAMYVGRWQNWHKGHEWLINQQLEKGKDVWVAIRNVPTDENNPKTAQQVMMDLSEETFFKENSQRINISIIPDIIIFSDEKNHASIISGIRHNNAKKHIFRHNDYLK